MDEKYILLDKLAEKFELENLTEGIDLSEIKITHPGVNRPAFQLTGYYEHFDKTRVQMMGKAENEYIKTLSADEKKDRFDRLFSYEFPAMILTRNIMPCDEIIKASEKYRVPVLRAKPITSQIMAGMITWISEQLAMSVTLHGVLVDVFGEGIFITGASGTGKSEMAIDLIKRGHRLVADDLVEIKKINEDRLVGTAPDVTRNFVELRGIGIVDIKSLYGAASVKNEQQIDMIINLEIYDSKKNYDRLGLEEKHGDILGVKVVKHVVPVTPGRNLSNIIETAAVNNRLKKMGYNAAQELVDRISDEIKKKKAEEQK